MDSSDGPISLPGLSDGISAARDRLESAETSYKSAKQEAKAAKAKRNEAREAARRAKKRLRRKKEELNEAKRRLAKAEAKHLQPIVPVVVTSIEPIEVVAAQVAPLKTSTAKKTSRKRATKRRKTSRARRPFEAKSPPPPEPTDLAPQPAVESNSAAAVETPLEEPAGEALFEKPSVVPPAETP